MKKDGLPLALDVKRWLVKSLYKSYLFTKKIQNCPICNSSGYFIYRNDLTDLHKCTNCYHVYAIKVPNDFLLRLMYSGFYYWRQDRNHQGITELHQSDQWNIYLSSRLEIINRMGILDTANLNVFEVGCSEGMLLKEIRDKYKANVAGCEINAQIANAGIGVLGIPIMKGSFESITINPNAYDLIISYHTLEHMVSPCSVLEKICFLLKSNGTVVINVPCDEAEFDNLDHLHTFSSKSLRFLLEKYFVSVDIFEDIYENVEGLNLKSLYGIGKILHNNSH